MSIAKPFTFTANTYAKASEVNANFDTVYSQVNTNISAIAQNATDIDNLDNNKANLNGSTSQRFAVADPVVNGDAVNKQFLLNSISNSIGIITGLSIVKDSGSPNDTIIVGAGSCYNNTYSVLLSLASNTSKKNQNQAANATYYVYIIGNSTGSLIDILISTNQVAPTLPAGYSLYRQIGMFTTDSSSKIDSISYYGIGTGRDNSGNNIANGIMPKYSARVSISTNYTAPSNGLVVISWASVSGTLSAPSISVNDTKVAEGLISSASILNTFYAYILVSKGDVITFPLANSAYFFPLKGV